MVYSYTCFSGIDQSLFSENDVITSSKYFRAPLYIHEYIVKDILMYLLALPRMWLLCAESDYQRMRDKKAMKIIIHSTNILNDTRITVDC